VSNASDDFPEPERPVMQTSRFRGSTTVTSFRLCSRAPWTINCSEGIRASVPGRIGREQMFAWRVHTSLTCVEYNDAVIRVAALAVVVAALASGCGDDGSTALVWEGPPRPFDQDGTLPIDGFNAYLEGVEQPWEVSANGVAAEYALPLVGDARTLQASAGPEGSGPVTVTIDGLLDDSVAALRLAFALAREGDTWTVTEAGWTQRCQPGRGHQDFSPEPCV
jgi:hypothetical protein